MTNVEQGGRVALIMGASGGIGAEVARLLASRGMRVVVNYLDSREDADEEIGERGDIEWDQCVVYEHVDAAPPALVSLTIAATTSGVVTSARIAMASPPAAVTARIASSACPALEW